MPHQRRSVRVAATSALPPTPDISQHLRVTAQTGTPSAAGDRSATLGTQGRRRNRRTKTHCQGKSQSTPLPNVSPRFEVEVTARGWWHVQLRRLFLFGSGNQFSRDFGTFPSPDNAVRQFSFQATGRLGSPWKSRLFRRYTLMAEVCTGHEQNEVIILNEAPQALWPLPSGRGQPLPVHAKSANLDMHEQGACMSEHFHANIVLFLASSFLESDPFTPMTPPQERI
jgi:hypothetical protein